MDNNSLSILITGDFVVNKHYDVSKLDDKIIDLFKQSDLNIVNLEAPVTSSNVKILKTGPHLKADEGNTLEILKALKVDVVTLANNHVLDYDEQGVSDTLFFCKKNNFQTVGAGMNLKEASKTLYLDTQEGKIAIVNFAENEWSSATENTAGANPMDIIDNAKEIKEAKQNADYVFVIVHGGHEYYNLPSPRMQKQYRFYAEQGADIVVGHHTHCISGHETHKGVPIYYSLGNFLFTKNNTREEWYTGLVLEIDINNGKLYTKLHPIRQQKESFELNLLINTEKEIINERIDNYSNIIKNQSKLSVEWDNYVSTRYSSYLHFWSPLFFINNQYLRAVFVKLRLKLINKKALALSLNLMRCEAHLDVSKETIKKYLSK